MPSWPLVAWADRYATNETDGGGSGSSYGYMVVGALLGAGLGYLYTDHLRRKTSETLSADGYMILGGMVGAGVFPMLSAWLMK